MPLVIPPLVGLVAWRQGSAYDDDWACSVLYGLAPVRIPFDLGSCIETNKQIKGGVNSVLLPSVIKSAAEVREESWHKVTTLLT